MFRATIRIDDSTDIASTLNDFRHRCTAGGVKDATTLVTQVEHAISDFAQRGAQLAAVGSQLHVEKSFEGHDYKVAIKAHFGAKPSFRSKLASVFRRK